MTTKTGFLGINTLKVGFEAPGLIYYKWDYSGVRALTTCCVQSKLYSAVFDVLYWNILCHVEGLLPGIRYQAHYVRLRIVHVV